MFAGGHLFFSGRSGLYKTLVRFPQVRILQYLLSYLLNVFIHDVELWGNNATLKHKSFVATDV